MKKILLFALSSAAVMATEQHVPQADDVSTPCASPQVRQHQPYASAVGSKLSQNDFHHEGDSIGHPSP